MTNKEMNRRAKISIVKQAAKFNGCIVCSYATDTKKLEFHHLKGKINDIGRLRGLGEVLNELLKCTVVCAKCHHKVTHGKIFLAEHLTFSVEDLQAIAGYVNYHWEPKTEDGLSDIPF